MITVQNYLRLYGRYDLAQEVDAFLDIIVKPGLSFRRLIKETVDKFIAHYDKPTALVEQYSRDLAAWERQVKGEEKPRKKPPEKESIRKKLRDMEAEAKRRNDARRQQTRPRSHDYNGGR